MNKLALVVDNGPSRRDGPRVLAPGAPPSPGSVPNELAALLEHGEVVAWWGRKSRMQLGLVWITLGAALVALAMVSAFAPTFWLQPWDAIAAPLAALFSPTAFVLAREWVGRAAIVVTDQAVVVADLAGDVQRIPLAGLRAIHRDWLRGGVQLQTARQRAHVPAALAEGLRAAMASRFRGRILAATDVDDPLGWLP